MNKPATRKDTKNLSNEFFQKSLKEADLYVTQGLFNEAREIYESLSRQVNAWMMEATSSGKQVGQSARRAIKVLEERLGGLQRQVAAFEKKRVPLEIEHFRERMKEADLYISNGLFDEAGQIYRYLILQIRSWLKETAIKRRLVVPSAYKALNILEERLKELQRQVEIFRKKRVPLEMARWDRTEQDEEAIFNLALALKGTSLTPDAIEELRGAEKLEEKAVESFIEIADFLIQKKEFTQGNEIFRRLIDGGHVKPDRKIEILQKMASSYESLGDRKKAIESYRELIASDRIYTEASQKIEYLTKEIRRIRLSIAAVTQHPKFFFVASLFIACFFIAFIPFARTVNNVDYFTLENDPDIQYYDNFKEIFGNDEFFVIAFEKDDIFTEDTLTLIEDITQNLEEIEEIDKVTSLANVDDIVGAEEYFEVRKFLDEIPNDPEGFEKLKDQAINNTLYANNLISKDAKTTSIVINPFDRPEDEDYRKRLLRKTDAVLDRFRKKVDNFHMGGWTITNLRLSQYMKKDVETFIPITYIFITLAIWIVFRNLILTLLAIVNISVCAGSVMGLFGLTGITINNVTTIIPSMVMALALCDTVHIFSHMDKRILS
ncbi:MAG: MMPL family transporter, partial [Thermodesulfobacteriota bacterium]|nr:MMPL family transporter [Thermodesulfobacteriota bacterium]